MSDLNIRNFTRHEVPGLLFPKIANEILPEWEISLVFAGKIRAQRLNVLMRKKTYVPNVLSYKVGNKHGEIIICPIIASKHAHKFGISPYEFTVFLFIHGLLHLKGYRHGTTMDKHEWNLLSKFVKKQFITHDTKNSNRNRYRDVPDKNGRCRGSN